MAAPNPRAARPAPRHRRFSRSPHASGEQRIYTSFVAAISDDEFPSLGKARHSNFGKEAVDQRFFSGS
jgi:hypothetical protein